MNKQAFVFEPFDLPVFELPQKEHWPADVSWDRAMQEFEAMSPQDSMQFHSPEARLRDKNSESFSLE